ncbi:MAG TPA: hypothetical protein VHU91_01840 [Mycobacteriales bacterium]|jgi:hypothetical protein|nr:hypothetical protein [Mycobacteriales bacterium]
MSWAWRYFDDTRTAVLPRPDPDLPEQAFPSQSDAESWLGEHWRELRAAGVSDVELLESDTVRYEMSLAAADD